MYIIYALIVKIVIKKYIPMSGIKLILPREEDLTQPGVEILDTTRENVYFLAGPIQGGGNWQEQAIIVLAAMDPDCIIICPRRYKKTDKLFSEYQYIFDQSFPSPDVQQIEFESHTEWGRYYLEKAAFLGSIIFFLPNEDVHDPRNDGSPYARDTYGELGRWGVRSGQNKEEITMTVGIARGFPGRQEIKKNLKEDHKKAFKIHDHLHATLHEAVLQVGNKRNSTRRQVS